MLAGRRVRREFARRFARNVGRELGQQRLVARGRGAGRPDPAAGRASGAAPGPPASGRPGRGRRSAAPRGRPSPGTRPAGCTADTRAARVLNDSSSADASFPMHTRQQPGHRLDDHERGALPAREDEVADRQFAVAQMVGDALVDPFVAAADQRETSVAGREFPRVGLVEPAPARRQQQQRTRRAAPPRPPRTTGPGVITIPAPPPNGSSSTLRCRSVVNARGSCSAHVEHARGAGAPEQRHLQRRVEDTRERS